MVWRRTPVEAGRALDTTARLADSLAMRSRILLILLVAAGIVPMRGQGPPPAHSWPVYAADNAATHYSPLGDITLRIPVR